MGEECGIGGGLCRGFGSVASGVAVVGGLFPPKSEEACDLCSVEVRGEFGSGGVELCATGARGRIYNMAEGYRAFERALDSPIKSDECGGMGGR